MCVSVTPTKRCVSLSHQPQNAQCVSLSECVTTEYVCLCHIHHRIKNVCLCQNVSPQNVCVSVTPPTEYRMCLCQKVCLYYMHHKIQNVCLRMRHHRMNASVTSTTQYVFHIYEHVTSPTEYVCGGRDVFIYVKYIHHTICHHRICLSHDVFIGCEIHILWGT